MLTLVTGGSASGKSEYAENLLCNNCKGKKLYIATMRPHCPGDAEFSARVERHRLLRAGKGFLTVERYTELSGLTVEPGCAVLLECLSNLCANEFFDSSTEVTAPDFERAYRAVMVGIENLCAQAGRVVVVSNEVFSDGCAYDAYTLEYLRLLGLLNQGLAARAQLVVEVVYGIPVIHKREGGWEE